jgi:hypothetical protein
MPEIIFDDQYRSIPTGFSESFSTTLLLSTRHKSSFFTQTRHLNFNQQNHSRDKEAVRRKVTRKKDLNNLFSFLKAGKRMKNQDQ